MFNIGSGEIALIAVVALLLLGPKRLPELARGIGKFLREFRRQTDEVRNVVEREFYRMDNEPPPEPPLKVQPASEAVALGAHTPDPALPASTEPMDSQLTRGMPKSGADESTPNATPGDVPEKGESGGHG